MKTGWTFHRARELAVSWLSERRRSTLSRGALTYGAANIANAAVPLLLLPILTRFLSPADYGLVAMFGLTMSALNAIVGLNAGSAVTVRYFQLPTERVAFYIGNAIVVLIASTVVVLSAALIFDSFITDVTQLPVLYVALAILASASQFLTALRLTVWQVQGSALRYGALQVGQSVSNAAISLALVVLMHMSWHGRIYAQVTTGAVFAIIAVVSLRRAGVLRIDFNPRDIKDAVFFGVPLIPHIGGALLIAAADRVLIAHMLSLADAGIYVVGAQLGLALGLLTDAFNRAYAPWLYSQLAKQDAEWDRKVVRGTYAYFVAVILLALLISAVAPVAVSIFAGPEFAEAAAVIPYITLGSAFGGMYYMVTNYVFYVGKTGRLALVTLSAGAFNIGATYLLIQQNGLVGAAQGFALSQLALFGGTWWLAQRCRPMPWASAWTAKAVSNESP